MKKVISAVLSVCLVIALLTSFAYAANAKYTVAMEDDKSAVINDEVTVNVLIGSEMEDKYNSCDMVLTYDNEKLEYVSPKSAGLIKVTHSGENARIQFVGDDKSIGEYTIIFKAKMAGEASVKVLTARIDNSAGAVSNDAPYAEIPDDEIVITISDDCPVTFEENGGREVSDQTVKYGEKLTKPEDPTREGYIFKGWFLEDMKTKWDFENDTAKGRMTLFAKWEKEASEIPEDPEDSGKPDDKPENGDKEESSDENVNTGDDNNMIMWIIIASCAFLAFVSSIVICKKAKRNN